MENGVLSRYVNTWASKTFKNCHSSKIRLAGSMFTYHLRKTLVLILLLVSPVILAPVTVRWFFLSIMYLRAKFSSVLNLT